MYEIKDETLRKKHEEYLEAIDKDFLQEWDKKKFKWLFKNRRQRKLRSYISRRYTHPIFHIIEHTVEKILLDKWKDDNFIENFVDFKKFQE